MTSFCQLWTEEKLSFLQSTTTDFGAEVVVLLGLVLFLLRRQMVRCELYGGQLGKHTRVTRSNESFNFTWKADDDELPQGGNTSPHPFLVRTTCGPNSPMYANISPV